MAQPHDERIAQLRRDFKDGVVEPNIYFSSKSARFRVNMNNRWIGTYWTLTGARRAKMLAIISKEKKKLARQEQAVTETKRRISNLEAKRESL